MSQNGEDDDKFNITGEEGFKFAKYDDSTVFIEEVLKNMAVRAMRKRILEGNTLKAKHLASIEFEAEYAGLAKQNFNMEEKDFQVTEAQKKKLQEKARKEVKEEIKEEAKDKTKKEIAKIVNEKAKVRAKEMENKLRQSTLEGNVSHHKLDLAEMFGCQFKDKDSYHETAQMVIEFCKKNQQVLFANIGPFYLEKETKDVEKENAEDEQIKSLTLHVDSKHPMDTYAHIMSMVQACITPKLSKSSRKKTFSVVLEGRDHYLLCNQIRYFEKVFGTKQITDCNKAFKYLLKLVATGKSEHLEKLIKEPANMFEIEECQHDKECAFTFEFTCESANSEVHHELLHFLRKFRSTLHTTIFNQRNLKGGVSYCVDAFEELWHEDALKMIEQTYQMLRPNPPGPVKNISMPNCLLSTQKIDTIENVDFEEDMTQKEIDEVYRKHKSRGALVVYGSGENAKSLFKFLKDDVPHELKLIQLHTGLSCSKSTTLAAIQKAFSKKCSEKAAVYLVPFKNKKKKNSTVENLVTCIHPDIQFSDLTREKKNEELKEKFKSLENSQKGAVLKPIFKAYLVKLIKQNEDVTEDFHYNDFSKGANPTQGAIKCKAASVWENNIRIKVMLHCNVEIPCIKFQNTSCSCKITGLRKNVDKAKSMLEYEFMERNNRLKSQLIPKHLFLFCQEKGILDDESLWRQYEVKKNERNYRYKKSDKFMVEIQGSSKCVYNFYQHIKDKYTSQNNYNYNENWFKDVLTFPIHYQIAMMYSNLPQDMQKRREFILHEEFWDNIPVIEAEIIEALEIEFPEDWKSVPNYAEMKPEKHHYELEKHEFCERVPTDDPAYSEVQKALKQGRLTGAGIREIIRVKNPFLWRSYYCKKQAKLYELTGNPHYKGPEELERMLWHGSSQTPPGRIIESEEGIDRRFSKPKSAYSSKSPNPNDAKPKEEEKDEAAAAKFYGNGTYFSTMPGYSDNQYAFKVEQELDGVNRGHKVRQLILCRVYCGVHNFGLVAMESDSMRTLQARNTRAILDKLKKYQENQIEQAIQQDIEYLKKDKARKEREMKKNPNKENLLKKEIAKIDKDIEKKKKEAMRDYFVDKINFKERMSLIRDTRFRLHGALLRKNDAYRFDSIMDDRFMVRDRNGKQKVDKPRMFVCFDNAQAYPEYIVTYTKYNESDKKEDKD